MSFLVTAPPFGQLLRLPWLLRLPCLRADGRGSERFAGAPQSRSRERRRSPQGTSQGQTLTRETQEVKPRVLSGLKISPEWKPGGGGRPTKTTRTPKR